MRLKDLISVILGIPKSILINFKYFPIKTAIIFPILVSNNVIIKKLKGKIHIESNVKTGIVKIGFGDIAIFDRKREKSIWDVNGEIKFKGKADFGPGSRLSINKNAQLKIGNNFCLSASSSIICTKEVKFGNNCLVSWDCLIMDTDFHEIKNSNGDIINANKRIEIGNNVWISCRNIILKGSFINDNNVIAANSTICGIVNDKNKVLGGNPCSILKNDITWSK